MTISEITENTVNSYVQKYGYTTVMTRKELYKLINTVYPIKYNSFIPSDYCYNRTNNGIHFEHQPHYFEYIGRNQYLLLGSIFPYSGKIIHCPNDGEEYILGWMEKGKLIL